MNDSKISVRYAKALYELALENDKLVVVESDMKLLLEISELEDFRTLIQNPVIPSSKKIEIFNSAFKAGLSDLSLSLANQLFRSGREQYIPAIARNFIKSSVKQRGITQVSLTTAVTASNKVKKDIEKMVSEKFSTQVLLKEIVDKDIVGGFVLRIDDNMIDASVRNRLKKIRKTILKQ